MHITQTSRSVRIVGIPELRYTPLDHAPHLMVHSFNRPYLRTPVLEAPALGMAKKAGE
jgi:hypothetical protein